MVQDPEDPGSVPDPDLYVRAGHSTGQRQHGQVHVQTEDPLRTHAPEQQTPEPAQGLRAAHR